MLSTFEAGAKEDQEEAEGELELVSLSFDLRTDSPLSAAILAEFDALSKEIQLWAHARITKTTENERAELTRESEQLKEIEQAQGKYDTAGGTTYDGTRMHKV